MNLISSLVLGVLVAQLLVLMTIRFGKDLMAQMVGDSRIAIKRYQILTIGFMSENRMTLLVQIFISFYWILGKDLV